MKVHKTSIFGVLDKPLQSTYDMFIAKYIRHARRGKITHNEQQITESNNSMFNSITMDVITGNK